MKKLFLLFLIVLLAVPSAVFADSSDFVGCWAVFIPKSATFGYGDQSIVVTLHSDGTMTETMIINKSDEKDTIVNSITATWMYYEKSEAILFQPTDSDQVKKFPVSDGMIWVRIDTMRFGLKKLPDMDVSQLQYIGQ